MSKNTSKKKIFAIAGALAVAAGLLIGGTLAVFTARVDSDFEATVGTVRIELDNLNMTYPNNINPGDNDPANPELAVEGTEHVFSYDVYNTGTKSVRTRHTIMLTVDKAGDSEELLDARYLALYIDNKEIADKYYVMEDGSVRTSLAKDDVNFVSAVKYVFLSDIFDGKGVDIEKGGNAEKEAIANVVKQNASGNVVKSYDYDFSLLREADNKYQGCDVNIEVMVEALQYRNTAVSDWDLASIVVRQYTSADVTVNVVPAVDENREGNKIQK